MPAGEDLIYMESIKVMLISRYEHIAYTHRYVFGFSYGGMIYAYQSYGIGDNAILDRASSKCGGGYSLRYKPTKKQKETLINAGIARPICSTDYFNGQVVNSKYNRGEIFEKMVTERAGQEWKKDNRKFTESGDLEVNGRTYQVKFEKATYTTEKILERLEREA